MPFSRDRKRESLELILLSVLSDRSLYGYAIIKQIAAQSDGELRLSPGVLYPVLHDLEKQGLISASWEEVRSDRKAADDDADGRRRKWYSVSTKGRRRLVQRIHSHRAQQAMLDSFIPSIGEAEGRSTA